jgi:hypothetical protein
LYEMVRINVPSLYLAPATLISVPFIFLYINAGVQTIMWRLVDCKV